MTLKEHFIVGEQVYTIEKARKKPARHVRMIHGKPVYAGTGTGEEPWRSKEYIDERIKRGLFSAGVGAPHSPEKQEEIERHAEAGEMIPPPKPGEQEELEAEISDVEERYKKAQTLDITKKERDYFRDKLDYLYKELKKLKADVKIGVVPPTEQQPSEEALDSIRNMRASGISDEDIEVELRAQGLGDKDIADAFDGAEMIMENEMPEDFEKARKYMRVKPTKYTEKIALGPGEPGHTAYKYKYPTPGSWKKQTAVKAIEEQIRLGQIQTPTHAANELLAQGKIESEDYDQYYNYFEDLLKKKAKPEKDMPMRAQVYDALVKEGRTRDEVSAMDPDTFAREGIKAYRAQQRIQKGYAATQAWQKKLDQQWPTDDDKPTEYPDKEEDK